VFVCAGFTAAAPAQSPFSPVERAAAQKDQQGRAVSPQKLNLSVKIIDENGSPVTSARVVLQRAQTQTLLKGETNYAGQHEFAALESGLYQLQVEKEGFYAAHLKDLRVSETQSLEITLHHQQELAESLNVVDSVKDIDPDQTAASENLNYREILNLPYQTNRDIRSALPFIPGVLQDATGQIHVGGAATTQIIDQLDGFNITQPTSGLFTLRISPDALREVTVQSSRYAADLGKASGGVLSLNTTMGDDHYRFSATNFVPSVQTRKGLNINDWTPRATFSGPLRQRKAWFFDAFDAEYKLNIVNELPSGADRGSAWREGNLAKVQINLSQTNTLTAGLLVNQFSADHAGLSRFDPLETTRDQRQSTYLFTVKDQTYLANGLLLEFGFGFNQFRTHEQPQDGSVPYVLSPEGSRGNYFRTTDRLSRRLQGIANLTLPVQHWHGRHEFRLGGDLDRINADQSSTRRPILIRREDGTLSRQITFVDSPRFDQNNSEVSGFVQDRWSVTERWLIEAGLRLDWDQIVRQAVISPRIASTYLLSESGETKLTIGAGLFYDATNLDLISRPLAGRRVDVFYGSDGRTPLGAPVETSFQVDQQQLKLPRFINWSLGVEQKLPAAIYMRIELLQKRGSQGFDFIPLNRPGLAQSLFELRNERRDRYDSASITLRKALKEGYQLLVSYTRSSARSNAVLDFTLDNPVFSSQAGGPLPWDAPDRLLSWGWMPLIKGFDFAYALDWRDGYPFNVVDQEQRLVGAPNGRRFPSYFSLNLHLERHFRLLGLKWAVRAGFNNATNRENPTVVNNNIDSPQFLSFGGTQHRVFTGRIRFLGRK
jgi:hypothetical protein